MGTSSRVVVSIIFVLLFKDWILIRVGQLGSLTLWGVSQLAQLIGGWVQVGPLLQVGMVHGWSFVLWASVQTAQWDRFLHIAAGCL